MKKLDKLIENIFKYCTVGMSKEDKDASLLVINTEYAAFTIKQNCEMLLKHDNLKSECLKTIFRMCNFDYNKCEMTVFGRHPNEYSSMLIRYCKDILDILELNKSRNETELMIINKYTDKWLYFEGYDCGSVVAKINDIYKVNDKYAFSGVIIKLSYPNYNFVGINTEYVEDYSFEDLPYFDNVYPFGDGIEKPISSAEYLDSWLSYNEYGVHVNCKNNSREIDECSLRKLTIDHLDKCIDFVSQNMCI